MDHLAIIMDGNRRYAKARGVPIWEGHRKGAETIERMADSVFTNHGIKTLTVYGFSLKNFARNQLEKAALFKLLEYEFKKLAKEPKIFDNDVKVRAVGRIDLMPENVRRAISQAEEATKNHTKHEFNLAVAYDGRDEIVHAVNEILRTGAREVTEELIEKNLFLSNAPDLIIRTGGEQRLSGFLLWLSSYSELFFTDTYWPDFSEEILSKALDSYKTRERRFGH